MKNLLPYIFVLLLFSLLNACQKNPEDPNHPKEADTRLLISKLVYFDDALTDTSVVNIFNYDGQKRVTSINQYWYDNGFSEIANTATYYYNGLDSLPFKTESSEEGSGIINKSTDFHFYDNAQRLIRDSIISVRNTNTEKYTINYTYATDKITETWKDVFSGNTDYYNTGYIDIRSGNIIKVVTNDLSGRIVTSLFTYDAHPNPINNINIRFTLRPLPSYDNDAPDDGRISNNILTETTTGYLADGIVFNKLSTYTYNANGYPETVKFSRDNGQTYYEKTVFVYK